MVPLLLLTLACTDAPVAPAATAGTATEWRPGDTGAFGLSIDDGLELQLVDPDWAPVEVLDTTLTHGPGGWSIVLAAWLHGLDTDEGLLWEAESVLPGGTRLVGETWVAALAEEGGSARIHQARNLLEPSDDEDAQAIVCGLDGLEAPLYVTVTLTDDGRRAATRQTVRFHLDTIDEGLCR